MTSTNQSKTPKREISKRVNLGGYYNKYGTKVGPYKKTFKKYPNHYFTELIDPNTGQPRLAEVWVKGKQRRSRWVEDKRKAKLISLAMAKEAFERQPQKAKSKDLTYRAKKVFDQDNITTSYITNPGRSDVEDLDTPPSKKVEKKESKLIKEKPEVIKPKTSITDADKEKVAEIRKEYGFKSIISPTTYKRDKPLGDKPYSEYLKETEQSLKEQKLYVQNIWDVSNYLNESILTPEEYKKEGKSIPYEEYINKYRLKASQEKEKKQKETDERVRLRQEKEDKIKLALEQALPNIETEKDLKKKVSEIAKEFGEQDVSVRNAFGAEQYYKKERELKEAEERLLLDTGETGERIDETIKTWNAESYKMLKQAIGSKEAKTITSKELMSGNIINAAVITGSDPEWGLKRSWLGETEWSRSGRIKSKTYSESEAESLPLGSLVEIKDRQGTKIWKKTDSDKWALVSEKQGYDTKIYGIVSKARTSKKSQQELQLLVEEGKDIGTRINALKQIKDEKFLELIATSDKNYRMKSIAYRRLKEINPESPKLKNLREYYQKSKEQEKEAILQYRSNEYAYIYGKVRDKSKMLEALPKISRVDILTDAMKNKDNEIALLAYEQMKQNRLENLKDIKKRKAYSFINDEVIKKIETDL